VGNLVFAPQHARAALCRALGHGSPVSATRRQHSVSSRTGTLRDRCASAHGPIVTVPRMRGPSEARFDLRTTGRASCKASPNASCAEPMQHCRMVRLPALPCDDGSSRRWRYRLCIHTASRSAGHRHRYVRRRLDLNGLHPYLARATSDHHRVYTPPRHRYSDRCARAAISGWHARDLVRHGTARHVQMELGPAPLNYAARTPRP